MTRDPTHRIVIVYPKIGNPISAEPPISSEADGRRGFPRLVSAHRRWHFSQFRISPARPSAHSVLVPIGLDNHPASISLHLECKSWESHRQAMQSSARSAHCALGTAAGFPESRQSRQSCQRARVGGTSRMQQGGEGLVVWHRGFRNLDCGANYRWRMGGTAHPIVAQTPCHGWDGQTPTACCCREAEVRAAYETSAANCPVSGTSCPSQLQSSNYCTEHTVQQYRTHTSGFGSRCRTSRTSTRPVGMITAFAPNAIALPRATRPPWAKQRAQGALIGPIAPPIPQ